jgi:autotransporter-associated beta strand protein
MTTVIDHDVNVLLSFLTDSNSVYSNIGSVPVYVVCGSTNGEPVSVGYATADGSAIAGVDYTATTGTLTFTNARLTNVFYVPIHGGPVLLGSKNFSVILSAPTGTGVLAFPTNEVISILWTNATPGPTVTWLGSNTKFWNSDSIVNWMSGQAFGIYADGDNVIFDDGNYDSTNVVINGSVAPGSVTYANSTNSAYTLSGGSIDGSTSLVKSGSGAASLLGGNLYTGGTLINGGLLLVNNTNGSGTGVGAVTVTGGILGGTGLIAGPVTVEAGGGFAPGNPLGTLTISNNLTLATGAMSYFKIQRSPPANNSARIAGTLTVGGTLVVTNTGAAAFSIGDSFILFNAGSYAGAFAGLVLPPLPSGLGWSASILNTSGVLTVVVAPPVINSVAVSPGTLVFQGSSGVPGANFYLLGSTNLAAPMTNWTRLLTNAFDNNGNFDFTNLLNANGPQSFFRLQAP